MSDQQAVDLVEFERLRDEIDSRTQLSNQLLSYELAALGAGIAVLDKYPDVLLGLAAISTFLWLFWIDHTTQIYKIAAYIELKIARRLRAQGGELLGWERFLRDIDAGGERRERAMYGKTTGKHIEIQKTEWVSNYTSWLLGYSTLALLVVYSIPKMQHITQIGLQAACANISIFEALRSATALVIVAVWWFARRQYHAFVQTRNSVRDAIYAADVGA